MATKRESRAGRSTRARSTPIREAQRRPAGDRRSGGRVAVDGRSRHRAARGSEPPRLGAQHSEPPRPGATKPRTTTAGRAGDGADGGGVAGITAHGEHETRRGRELTLKDRLSRLTFTDACKLLGGGGDRLIRAGGRHEIQSRDQIHLGDDLFRLSLDGAVVTITLMAEARQRLHWNCTRCDGACEHVGAALSLILEEKVALGLAAPPPERVPIESLGEQELIEQAIAEREERSREERMTIRSTDSESLWTDYLVTNRASGKSYRVALRGMEPGDSYCACPDFRKNTLGVCKHILAVQRMAKRRFPAAVISQPWTPREIAVHLRYGPEVELRLLTPERLDPSVATIVGPLVRGPIEAMPDLLHRIGQLEAQGHEVTVYPDAEEYIEQRLFQHRMSDEVARIRRDPAGHPLRKELLKAELLPYQLDGVAFAAGAGRAILADDMGLGKTIQGIGVAELLRREAGIRRVLIVCPASLKSQWRGEIQRFADLDCQLVLGSAAERARQYHNDCFFTICNYEQVLRDILPIEQAAWDLIILDEGQRIKNWEAKTSRVIKGLRSRFALVLSGTPLENRLDELFSVVEFIDDRRLGPAFRFFNRHRVVDEKGKVLGYKNLADLRERLKPVLLRRTRASVMRDLPPRSTEIVRIAPSDEQAELHQANLRIVSSIVRKPYINEMDLLRLRKALLMCRMSADSTFLVDKREPAYSTKLTALDDLLGSLLDEDDRKIVLFSEWTTMLGLIEPLLAARQADYVRLDGDVPQKQRQALVRRFQEDATCRVFITSNAGATGLNLQAANTVINVDLPWNPAVLEQRIARAHRMGQRRPVQVYVLVTEGTIEENLLATLSAKHDLALAALDADSTVDALDLQSGTNELKNRLEILLGERPDAPIDQSGQAASADDAERLARREKVALAAGDLLTAAFAFIDGLLPEPGAVVASAQAAAEPAAQRAGGALSRGVAPPARAPAEPAAQRAGEALSRGAAAPAAAGWPRRPAALSSQQLAAGIRERLEECLQPDADGRAKLTVTLSGPDAIERLSGSLARLLSHAPNAVSLAPGS